MQYHNASVRAGAMNHYPLREQRKQRSREALLKAASRLFACQGFQDTTLEEIAEQAGLHVQTLYRHFPNKAELAAAIDRRYFERFRDAFQDRTTDTLTFWREWVEKAARRLTRDGGARYRHGLRNFYTQPSLSGTYLQTWNEYEEILADGLRRDFGELDAHQENLPLLVACMLWAGNRRAAYEWAKADGKRDLAADCVAVVDTVIDQFGHLVKRPNKPTP